MPRSIQRPRLTSASNGVAIDVYTKAAMSRNAELADQLEKHGSRSFLKT
jgi:hypothetical protein